MTHHSISVICFLVSVWLSVQSPAAAPAIPQDSGPAKTSRNTSTARGILRGKWTSEGGKQVLYYNWPEVITVEFEPYPTGTSKDGKPLRPKKGQPSLVRRLTRWSVTMGLEGRDRTTMRLGTPSRLRSRGPGYVLGGYELQFDFGPDFSFAMVTRTIGREVDGPFRWTWSDEPPPTFCPGDTIVWLKQDDTRANSEQVFHRKECVALKKEKGKQLEATIDEAQQKFHFAPCDLCSPHLTDSNDAPQTSKK